MQIKTNFSSLPNINAESQKRDKTLEKIATAVQLGMEESASRSIASMLQSDISGYSQGLMNANDAISMLQIVDGTLNSLSDGAQTLNDLSVRYNNAALSEGSREALNSQFARTVESMQQSLSTASFNGQPLFGNSFTFSLGEGSITADIANPSPQSLTIENQESIAAYTQTVSSLRSDIGSTTNGLISSTNSILEQISNTSAAKSQIADTDMANAVNEFQRGNRQLDAAQIAMAHQTDVLRQSITRLLG